MKRERQEERKGGYVIRTVEKGRTQKQLLSQEFLDTICIAGITDLFLKGPMLNYRDNLERW